MATAPGTMAAMVVTPSLLLILALHDGEMRGRAAEGRQSQAGEDTRQLGEARVHAQSMVK